MKITVIGGGPGGLYFALLMKRARSDADVTVYERNPPDATFGWGVVFSDETLGGFEEADPESYRAITENFIHWDDIDLHFRGETIRSGGHGFAGVARMRLLELLIARCRELGVNLRFETEIDSIKPFADSDVIVAADGVNSKIRAAYAEHFQPNIEQGRSKFIWLGTTRLFDAFTFIIATNEHGMFQVHAYRFDETHSTFIIETDEETFQAAGLGEMSVQDSVAYCERLFAPWLDGHALLTNKSSWINFSRVKNAHWFHRNIVLLGDAVHTAHFSVGSGTKLAMEDAIALADSLCAHDDVPTALAAYEDARWVDVAKLQKSAQVSREWFEDVKRYAHLDPMQLFLSLLSRSKRVTHENLRLRDPDFIARVDRWFADTAGLPNVSPPPPPMFTPFALRDMELRNRVVVSPMCMYSAEDGTVDDWHLVHLGSRALGGAALVIAEMTDVSRDGRISPGCAGLYKAEHVGAWKRIVDFVHQNTPAKIGVQLGHAGRKGSAQRLWERPDEPLPSGNWPLIAASPIAYREGRQVPREMNRADMDATTADFVRAAQMALEAGFDMLEIHMAHGYLFSSFISPLTNQRTDEYGGSIENRMRYPLEVFDAVRRAWPQERPISVRISATDWAPGGLTAQDSVAVAKLLQSHGCDLVDVSTGQTTPHADPLYGRMYQTPYADRIRHEVGIATMAVGAILGWDHVNTIIVSGRADLCAMARPHLRDPYLTLRAADEQGYYDVEYPPQYRSGAPRPPDPDANKRRR